MASDDGPDLRRVQTKEDFGHELKTLLGRPVRDIEAAAAELVEKERLVLRGRAGSGFRHRFEPLSKSAVSDYRRGSRVPSERALRTLLAIADVRSEEAKAAWFAVRRRVLTEPRPLGGRRVEDADPRLLGVHRAISADGATGFLPPYIVRDIDTEQDGLRAKVRAAAEGSGFILLVGGSSVGKTRSAYEAAKELLSGWWLAQPADPADPVEIRELVEAPIPRTVVWLDELQRYFGPRGLTAGHVRALLTGLGPIVLIGTIWPHRYSAYIKIPHANEPDPYEQERELLALADVVTLDTAFSAAEHDRARNAASMDDRIKLGLQLSEYSLPQALAAAPQLVEKWRTAKLNPYRRAVLIAALDVTLLGVTAPLSPDLLRAAAVDYCNRRDQARAGANWFEDALAFATEPLHGGVSALEPNAHGMSEITGYTIADYIQQHAQSERNGKYLPSSAWQAILDYCHDLPSIIAAAKAAVSCGLQVVATQFYRRAADAGENSGDYPLISLLAEQGRVDEAVSILQAQAHADFSYSLIASDLADMLANQDRVDDALSLLRARADAGDHSCASNLIDLLTKHGRVEELRARVHAGHRSAIFALVDLLVEQGNTEEAVAVLRAHTDVGTGYVRRLADLLAKQGHVDDAVSVLRASADAGNSHVGEWLVELLVEHGRTDEVRTRADLGDAAAARWLAGVLIEQGSTHEAASMLRANADTHYDLEAWQLIEKMIEQGSLDEAASVLQARVNAGDGYAVLRLPDLLAKQGNMDEAVSSLQDRADAGDLTAAHALAALLIRHGRAGDAESVLRRSAEAGDSYAALQLTYLLVEQGRIDETVSMLQVRADAGDHEADSWLNGLLADRGDLDQLRARADAGDWHAASRLAKLLAEQGRMDELRARVDAGDRAAEVNLDHMLVEQGYIEEALSRLRARADAGDSDAAYSLAHQLMRQGRMDEVQARADTGDLAAARRLVELLVEQGRTDEVQARADAGDPFAAQALEKM